MGYAMVAGGKPDMATPLSGIKASNLAVGSSVYLMEDGVAAEYLVVNQGIPEQSSLYDASCDGLWVLRKDIHSRRSWDSTDNDYQNSDVHSWLNRDFFTSFGTIEQAAIKQVKIPYVNGTGARGSVASGANGLSTKVFLLGGYEVGFSTNDQRWFPVDGAKLEYFKSGTAASAANKRVANLNGAAEYWYLRDPLFGNGSTISWAVNSAGGYEGNGSVTNVSGIRPALVLPSTALFDTNTMLLKGVA